MISSYGSGAYVAGEAHTLFMRRHRPLANSYGVVWSHGGGGGATSIASNPQHGAAVNLLADAGVPVIVGDLGGQWHWGNDTHKTRIQQVWDYLVAQTGCSSAKLLIITRSMGALTLNWVRDNPSKVAGVVCSLPAVDLQDIHDNDRGGAGYAASIEAAYGGAGPYSTAANSHNPAAHASDFVGIPMQLHYSLDDPVCIASIVQGFAATAGAELVSLGSVGHTDANLDSTKVYDFLRAHL